jgi:hypothetical protein
MHYEISGLRNQNQNGHGENSANQRRNITVKMLCRFCERDGHTDDRCFSMEVAERKLKLVKLKINELQENDYIPSRNLTSSEN